MLFVSRHLKYRHEIWSGEQRFVRGAGGSENLVTTYPNFTAEFQGGRLTELERQSAARQFGFSNYGQDVSMLANSVDLEQTPYKHSAAATAMPYREDGVLVGAVGSAGDAYTGYDPQFHMSSFDTDTDIDYTTLRCQTETDREAAKAECERRLTSSSDFGGAFVAVSDRTMPAPWSTYPTLKGESQATIQKLMGIIDDAGFDAAYVLEYERVTTKREKVMAALEDKAAEQRAAQASALAVREALTAEVR